MLYRCRAPGIRGFIMQERFDGIDQTVYSDQTAFDDLFLQGLREDSNLEMDWLWLASRVTEDGQRRYCFRRALAINPESRPAECGLAQLLNPRRQPFKLVWRSLLARAGRSMPQRLLWYGGGNRRS